MAPATPDTRVADAINRVLDAEREATEAEAARNEAESRRLVAAWGLNALSGGVAP